MWVLVILSYWIVLYNITVAGMVLFEALHILSIFAFLKTVSNTLQTKQQVAGELTLLTLSNALMLIPASRSKLASLSKPCWAT